MLQARFRAERQASLNEDPHQEAVLVQLGPLRLVDRLQVMGSVGGMGTTMRKHQAEVEKEIKFQAGRVRAPFERYADAVLASNLKHDWQDPGCLIVLKDEERQHEPNHRGWDIRVRPKDEMFTFLKKIRERVPGMMDAEGIVRTDVEASKGLKKRVRSIRQMKHGRTYLIRRRTAALGLAEAFELAQRFKSDVDPDDEASVMSKLVSLKSPSYLGAVMEVQRTLGSKKQQDTYTIITTLQAIYRGKQARLAFVDKSFEMARIRAILTLQRVARGWMARRVMVYLATAKQRAKVQSNWAAVRAASLSKKSRERRKTHWERLRESVEFKASILEHLSNADCVGALKQIEESKMHAGERFLHFIPKFPLIYVRKRSFLYNEMRKIDRPNGRR